MFLLETRNIPVVPPQVSRPVQTGLAWVSLGLGDQSLRASWPGDKRGPEEPLVSRQTGQTGLAGLSPVYPQTLR